MKVYLASDHAGFELKEGIKSYLLGLGFEVEDLGAFSFLKEDDYPDFVEKAAKKVSENALSFGIIFGKSGGGETIVANKIKGVRCVVGFNTTNVILAREHNDANILSLGSEFVDSQKARELSKLFLDTSFSKEERHVRRIDKIKKIEEKSSL